MSKKVLILLATGFIAILAAMFLLKYELTKIEEEPEEDIEEEEPGEESGEPEPEPIAKKENNSEQGPADGPREGYYYDKYKKGWFPCKKPAESESQDNVSKANFIEPEPVIITPAT